MMRPSVPSAPRERRKVASVPGRRHDGTSLRDPQRARGVAMDATEVTIDTESVVRARYEAARLETFERAGFHAITLEKYDEKPWQTGRGVEFRSATVTARKDK